MYGQALLLGENEPGSPGKTKTSGPTHPLGKKFALALTQLPSSFTHTFCSIDCRHYKTLASKKV
jgi:hypothetical protein